MNSAQQIVFRNATLADLSAVVFLVESAYRGDASREGWTTEADLLDGQRTDEIEIREIICGAHSRIRLAEQSPTTVQILGQDQVHAPSQGRALPHLVGCVRIENAGDAGYIGMVSVLPNLQSAGIGRPLLHEAERVIRDELRLPRARCWPVAARRRPPACRLRAIPSTCPC